MKNVSRKLILISLIHLGLISGCATPPPPLDTSKLPQIAEDVLNQAVYFNGLFSNCAKLGGEAEIQSISVQQDWLTANWPLVAAADQRYTQDHAADAINYQNHLISPKAIRMAQIAYQRAVNELSLQKRSTANQQKTCEFRLAQITPANIKLTLDPQIAIYAQALLASGEDTGESSSIARVPSLTGGVPLDLAPGKSYYRVLDELQSRCSDSYTLVVANDWPKEAYANFCGDQLKEVLTCEWGNCTASKL